MNGTECARAAQLVRRCSRLAGHRRWIVHAIAAYTWPNFHLARWHHCTYVRSIWYRRKWNDRGCTYLVRARYIVIRWNPRQIDRRTNQMDQRPCGCHVLYQRQQATRPRRTNSTAYIIWLSTSWWRCLASLAHTVRTYMRPGSMHASSVIVVINRRFSCWIHPCHPAVGEQTARIVPTYVRPTMMLRPAWCRTYMYLGTGVVRV
jgi:hypothetical protein